MIRQKIPTYDYEVVKGDTLDILVRYEPNGVVLDWATDDLVEVAVRLPDGTEVLVPPDRIEYASPSTDEDPNLVTYLTPDETESLPTDVPCTYQVRFVENGVKHTILTGVIVARYSAVDGV